MSTETTSSGIPFAFLCSLFREIAKIPARSCITDPRKKPKSVSYPALDIFGRWITELRRRYSPLPSGTAAICFRLLFPEEDTKRKYGIQEHKLALYLSQCFGLPSENLTNWHSNGSSGCLGHELQQLLQHEAMDNGETTSSLTIAEVDELLDELASTSGFTHISIRSKHRSAAYRRSKPEILKALYRPLQPAEAAFLTHIILKDLRPILYPFPDVHYSTALLDYNSNAVKMLSKEHAMNAWDTSGYMLKIYRVNACLDEAVTASELPQHMQIPPKPVIGNMIQLPKSVKGTSCRHVLSHFQTCTHVWAEPKYDGERAQIHVKIRNDGSSKITIFSKSGRDSTLDREGVHDIIRETLNLTTDSDSVSPRVPRLQKNIVLDAEMVAWCDDHIDEFWRIRGLIEQTAAGVRGKQRPRELKSPVGCDSSAPATDESQTRHLALIFFDILVLDDNPVLFQPYAKRRQLLESCIEPIATRATLSERYEINMSGADPHEALQIIFAEELAKYMEGIVVKADESQYNDFRLPWVKLKKDYIKGFGDCIDLAIVAAGWDHHRARELRVTPGVFTTFYVGAVTNTHEITIKPDTRPHLLIYFTVSYGLGRKELEDLNFRIRNGDTIPYPMKPQDCDHLPFTLTLSADLENEPVVILRTPFLAEVMGAGFTKKFQSKHYELRFPRLVKIHGIRERPWTECMDIAELDKIARECVGKDRKNKDIDDWCKTLWGKPTSPTISMKRRERVQDIKETLVNLERGARGTTNWSPKRRRLNQSTTKMVELSSDAHSSKTRMVPQQPEQRATMIGSSKIGKMENTAIGTPRTVSASPAAMLSEAVFCFASSQRNQLCDHCLAWKKIVPREQRVHSLEALLTVCSTGEGPARIRQGLIFVDDKDTATRESVLKRVVDRGGTGGIRVLVFSCSVDQLSEENALLVV